MSAVVLESSLGSQYEDSPTSYEFPNRYLRVFEGLTYPVYAVLYEPRGDAGVGSMRYVGWAEIPGPPVKTGGQSRGGQALYTVFYARPAEQFDEAVPREILGEPIEAWLRQYERGRSRNVRTIGRAVRSLEDADFQRIMELGGATSLELAGYPLTSEHRTPLIAARERSEVLVTLLKRSADFRREVISAYDERCAVSGFGLGRIPVAKARGLLDAAHIRPVSSDGSDDVSNGLPLTPTLHRLFDAGLFSIEYRDARPVVVVSPRLERTMIESTDARFRLDLRDGRVLNLPSNRSAWPNPEQLLYHRAKIFVAQS